MLWAFSLLVLPVVGGLAVAAVVERLSRDGESPVRRGVAGNRATPGELLRRLAHDPDPAVRSMVRANPSSGQSR